MSGGFTNEDTGLGDLTLTTGLGWTSGNAHWQVAASIFAPTGYYEKADVDVAARSVDALSFGKNRWAIMPAIAYTYLNPGNGRELSASASLIVSAENQATNYQTAPEFQVEWAAMQHLPSGLALGLAGYGYQQLGNDSGSGARAIQAATGAKSLEASVWGIGPLLSHNGKIGELPVSFKIKYLTEFDS